MKVALLSMVPLDICSCPATHVIVPLLVSVREIPTPPALIVNVDVAAIVVVPVPPIVPPVQENAPDTARSPVPSIVPPLERQAADRRFAVRVTVPL